MEQNKPDKGRIGLLVAALKSGLYEKGLYRLHVITAVEDGPDQHTWCCLGVAGDVARRFGLELPSEIFSCGGYPGTQAEMIDGCSDVMSGKVMNWYGFENCNPRLLLPDGLRLAAALVNDRGYAEKEYTLPEIGELFRVTYLEEA